MKKIDKHIYFTTEEYELFVSKIKNAPPRRVCYKITHTTPRLSSVHAVERFETLLEEHIKSLEFEFPAGELIGP